MYFKILAQLFPYDLRIYCRNWQGGLSINFLENVIQQQHNKNNKGIP